MPTVTQFITACIKALLVIFLAVASATSALAQTTSPDQLPFYDRRGEGWFWYEDKAPEPKERKPEQAKNPPAASPAPNEDELDLARFSSFQKQLDDAMKIATINPSDKNIVRVLTLMAETRRKAAVFTDAGMRVAALNPMVDDRYNGQNVRPPNPAATAAWDAASRQSQEANIKALAKTHGIFFFFKSDCPYCHAYAPLLKRFALRHGLTIFPVTMDGATIPDFPDAVPNNGIAGRFIDQLGIPREQFVVPFTVLAKPTAPQEIVPVGFGVMNEDELSERLDLFAREATRARSDARSPGWQAPAGTAAALGRTAAAAGVTPVRP